jgi:hypothetical protein
MPLVSKSIIERWYRTDSWVYRNFSFWFKNPLWDKRVPQGFSLCPYFWLSIFSLFVLRPIVGVVLGFKMLYTMLHLTQLIEWSDSLVYSITCGGPISSARKPMTTGGPTLAALALLTVITLVVGCIGFCGYHLCTLFYAHNALPALLIPFAILCVFVPCLIYRKTHPHSECKVENYTRIACIVGVIAMYFLMPVEFIEVVVFIPTLILALLFIVAKAIWTCITLIPAGLGWVWYGICVAAAFVWEYLLLFVTTFSTMLIMAFIGVVVCSVIGWLTATWYEKSGRAEAAVKLAEWNKRVNDYWGMIVWQIAAESREYLKVSEWEDVLRDRYPYAWEVARKNALGKHQTLHPTLLRKLVSESEEIYRQVLAERAAARKAREEACARFTASAGKALVPVTAVGAGMKYTAKGAGTVLHFIFVRCIWFILKEIGTFINLLWQLFWAWKKGACPYYRFEDPSKTTPSK